MHYFPFLLLLFLLLLLLLFLFLLLLFLLLFLLRLLLSSSSSFSTLSPSSSSSSSSSSSFLPHVFHTTHTHTHTLTQKRVYCSTNTWENRSNSCESISSPPKRNGCEFVRHMHSQEKTPLLSSIHQKKNKTFTHTYLLTHKTVKSGKRARCILSFSTRLTRFSASEDVVTDL